MVDHLIDQYSDVLQFLMIFLFPGRIVPRLQNHLYSRWLLMDDDGERGW